jgi:uncharacterized protein (DUF58 family)
MQRELGPYGPLLDALRGVAWPSRRHVRGAVSGTHRSRLRGVSPEFTEYRPYRQGDDPRRLDWKLLARTDRASVRVTSDRSTLGTVVAIDASASMAFPHPTLDKWVQGCRVAMGLAAVALAAGDPVGLIVATANGVRASIPRARRSVLEEAARLLGDVEPAGAERLVPALGVTGMNLGFRLVIVSDFLGDGDDLLALARQRYGAGGEVYAVQIVAREELEPGGAAIFATDPEAPEIRRPLSTSTRDEYKRAFGIWREELAREWRAAGAVYAAVPTDEAAERAVRRVVSAGAGASLRSAEW